MAGLSNDSKCWWMNVRCDIDADRDPAFSTTNCHMTSCMGVGFVYSWES